MPVFDFHDDGRKMLSGGVVRVEEERIDNRGFVIVEPLLINGRDVKFWYGNGILNFDGVGRSSVRITDRCWLKVFVDGVQVAVINVDNVNDFEYTFS